jgi:hypothetical protein
MTCPSCHAPECGCPATNVNPPPSADWPFHRLAAERAAVFEKIDRDVENWKREVRDAVLQGNWPAARTLLDRVVAVRA